ncbi:MAG TPA: hypothetical protein VGJ95_07690 [Pseudonocardiaceae bacterium]
MTHGPPEDLGRHQEAADLHNGDRLARRGGEGEGVTRPEHGELPLTHRTGRRAERLRADRAPAGQRT